MRRLLLLLLPVALAAGSAYAADGDDFRSLSDIESALDPLEFVVDYGGVRVSIDLTIAFAFDSDRILPEAEPQIEALGNALAGERLAGYRFRLIGHTDGVGSAGYNLGLSQRRAESVKKAMVDGYAIDPERLIAVGKGFTQPKPGLSPDDAAHRRVEVQTIRETDEQEPEPDNTDASDDGIRIE